MLYDGKTPPIPKRLLKEPIAVNSNSGIRRRFSRSAKSYDDNAAIQRRVAARLCALITHPEPKQCLELGCGTGFLSLCLLEKFQSSTFTLTDISLDMLAETRTKLEQHQPPFTQNITLKPLDFRELIHPPTEQSERYDLITASMVIHWGDNILKTLSAISHHLTENGRFYFSTIGPNTFKEWQQTLNSCGLKSGLRLPPHLPGIIETETITTRHNSAASFLNELRRTGAHGPRQDYTPLTHSELKRAMNTLEQNHNSTLTWEIKYGCLTTWQNSV